MIGDEEYESGLNLTLEKPGSTFVTPRLPKGYLVIMYMTELVLAGRMFTTKGGHLLPCSLGGRDTYTRHIAHVSYVGYLPHH